MSDVLPFAAEYAKSGRANCKKCKESIAKDSLRLAVMVQSPVFDGKMPLWHHMNCFFKKKNALKSTADIANFQNLRWEDQEKISKHISSASGSSGDSSEGSDFSVEYAKSNRSACKGCGEKINKDVVRISKLVHEEGSKYGPRPLWHHVDCFVQKKDELGFCDAADRLPGFKSLSEEDKQMLLSKISCQGVKRKSEDSSTPKPKKTVTTDKLLKVQNKMLFDMRDNLSKHVKKKEMIELLEHNHQHISSGESRLLDHLADCLVFGALKACPDCKEGRPRFLINIYKCAGNLTEWTKCQFETKFPAREDFVVPKHIAEKHPFLQGYKCTVRERRFLEVSEPSTSKKILPLSGYVVTVIGSSSFASSARKSLQDLGGIHQTTVSAAVNLCISTPSEIKKGSKKIKKAEENNIHIVSADFLDAVRKGSPVPYSIKEHTICTWGDDPILKFGIKKENAENKVKEEDTLYYKSSVPQKIKLSVKGAAAVDPESGLENSCHVYQKGKDIYSAVLAYVDTVKGTNSFYKLQLLKSNRSIKYHVFRQWGRVGTTIGGKKVEAFNLLEEGIAEFEYLYREKTGNEWWNRDNFEKKPGCMYPLDVDYGDDALDQYSDLKPDDESALPKPVQELICLIFDIEAMKKAMVEFEIDLKKMPLGKLSKKQIQSAYKVLSEAQQNLVTGCNSSKTMDVSNRFYTLIPHDFGMKKPPMLDNEDMIKSKVEMLDSLLEIEFAYSMLKRESSTEKDPVTEHYEKLNTDIEVLEKDSKEFEVVNTYLKNTHAQTHNQYKLELDKVFKINRHGEEKKYQKSKHLHNKKLLWHGSRLTNFVGILSQGLRIAPPEAPATGYMFGKGVYFADMVSKSANYCCTTKQNPTGLLLLCEVALGDMYERTYAEYIQKLPSQKHSTKGLGLTIPNPEEKVTLGDVEVPCGKPVHGNVKNGALLYNEYIVYDVNQINIKYLLQVNFKWKY